MEEHPHLLPPPHPQVGHLQQHKLLHCLLIIWAPMTILTRPHYLAQHVYCKFVLCHLTLIVPRSLFHIL